VKRQARRLVGRCYLCGDPCTEDGWFCRGHAWAGSLGSLDTNSLVRITREHAYWIERFTPKQVRELAACLEVR
jgi:hypothetical protein